MIVRSEDEIKEMIQKIDEMLETSNSGAFVHSPVFEYYRGEKAALEWVLGRRD